MKHLSHLNKYFKKYIWLLLLGTVFIIGTNLLKVEMPAMIDRIADLAEKALDKDSLEDPDSWYDKGLTLFLYFIGLAVGSTFLLFLTRQTIIVMSRHIEFDLKNEIYHKYQELSYSFYKVNSTGDIMNRISEDVNHIRMYLGPAVMYSINVFILFCLAINKMLNKDVMLTLYVLIPLPVMSVLIYIISVKINRKSEKVQRQQSTLSTYAQEFFSGIRILKSFGKEDDFSNRFNNENENYKIASLNLAKIQAFFTPVILLLIGMSTILTVYIGGLKVIDGDLDKGDIAQIVIYVNMLTWPIAAVGWVSSLVQKAAASQERVNEFLHHEIEVKVKKNAPKVTPDSIEFKNVSFTYPNTGIEALQNFNLSIKPGETVAITGKTGGGKSTVASLLERLFDVTSGQILINGENIQDIDLNHYRKNVGYVPQEIFLFSATIKENIAFGLVEEPTQETIEKFAKKAHVHHNIMDFKRGYETKIGERGVTLSGGQKQRVSIARALIRNPKLLILDDCLSAVDTETEEIILQSLKDEMNKCTALIIGHRISSLKGADRIVVLSDGKIVEAGTHDELLKLGGDYFTMYEQQLVDEI